MCDVFDTRDDGDADTDHARPHHVLDGLPVISWRRSLQARSKLKSGRAVGADGLSGEVVQRLSMRCAWFLWCLLNVTVWASTSAQTWTLSRSLTHEGPAHAESSTTQSGSMAPGVLGRHAAIAHSLGQNPQSHPFLTAHVLGIMPSTPVR